MAEPVATIFGLLLALLVTAVLIAVFTLIFRWLWNSTMPEVFGLKAVNFWQAFKILILASILFGSPRVIERQVEVESRGQGISARR